MTQCNFFKYIRFCDKKRKRLMNNLRHKQKYDAMGPPKKKQFQEKKKQAWQMKTKLMGNTEKTDKNTKKKKVLMEKRPVKQNGTRIQN